MKKHYLGILLITYFTYASSRSPKSFSDYDAHSTNEWNWVSKDQLADAQTSQVSWPRNGNSGSMKGKGDSNPNRDGTWTQDSWPSGGNRNDDTDMGWNTQPQGNNKGSAYPDGDGDQEGDLETILRGVPGMDFPNFVDLPETDFDCSSMPSQGYYGDVEAGCQVFHICQPGNRKDSFLCPVGTIFNQKYFVCDWWFNVNCSDTPSYYELNNEVYKDPAAVTEEVPVTTEKSMTWNTPDLDRKKPTKSWGNQPSTGKQNPNWKGTPARRGSKSSGTVSTSREVSNAWSRSDVQKEISLSWGASSSSPSETYASSPPPSNSVATTTKPIWYGIDGQAAKDQSDDVSKRVGTIQTPAPFGTRIRKVKKKTISKSDESIVTPVNPSSYKTTTADVGVKRTHIDWPSPTSSSWQKIDDIADSLNTEKGITWNNDVDYDYSTTKTWLKGKDIPETSINPTGIKGVWEQQTKKDSDFETSIRPTRIKGVWEQQTKKDIVSPTRVKEVWEKQTKADIDFETSISPTRVTGVWKQQTIKRLDPEVSINPTNIKGIWEQQTTKIMDPESSNPMETKTAWESQPQRRSNVNNPFDTSTVKSKNLDAKFSHTRQNRRAYETTSNQRKKLNQRRKYRNANNSTAVNSGWVQNSSRKRKATGNSNANVISHRQNWK